MLNIEARIHDFALESLPAVSKTRGYLSVCHTPAGTASIPVLVAVGVKKKPVLFAVGGVHGNEYEGQEAIRRFFEGIDPRSLEGSFVGIPVCNVFAYEAGARESPQFIDGANLARIFPGNPSGSLSERLAHGLFDLIMRTLGPDDLFVDFHSAEGTNNLLPLAGFRSVDNPSRERAEKAARCLQGFRLWEVPVQPGRLNSEVAVRGITAVGTEITGGAGCEEEDVKLYVRALESLSGFLGITRHPFTVNTRARPMRPVNILAPDSGYLRKLKNLGYTVNAGEVLGTIIAPAGETRAEVITPVGGLICGARRTPLVWAKEMCFWVSPDDSSLIS